MVDFMVTEAITVKASEERKKFEKQAQREAWRKKHRGLGKMTV